MGIQINILTLHFLLLKYYYMFWFYNLKEIKFNYTQTTSYIFLLKTDINIFIPSIYY